MLGTIVSFVFITLTVGGSVHFYITQLEKKSAHHVNLADALYIRMESIIQNNTITIKNKDEVIKNKDEKIASLTKDLIRLESQLEKEKVGYQIKETFVAPVIGFISNVFKE
jgi:uncharacterized protein (DUF3084 family)